MHALTRKVLPAILGLALVAPAAAQDQEQMQQNLEKKLAKSFVENGGWVLDYDEAKKIAKEEGKIIFAYFTRSYAP
ncbi:MAG: hypothetical protein ACPG31_10190 [Planctomycetota bacterium]